MSSDNDQKRKESPYMETSMDKDRIKSVHRKQFTAPKLCFKFVKKNRSPLSATSVLSSSPLAYNSTSSLDKLACTNYGTLVNVMADLNNFAGPTKTPIT